MSCAKFYFSLSTLVSFFVIWRGFWWLSLFWSLSVFTGFSGRDNSIHNIIPLLKKKKKKENVHLYACPCGYNKCGAAYFLFLSIVQSKISNIFNFVDFVLNFNPDTSFPPPLPGVFQVQLSPHLLQFIF